MCGQGSEYMVMFIVHFLEHVEIRIMKNGVLTEIFKNDEIRGVGKKNPEFYPYVNAVFSVTFSEAIFSVSNRLVFSIEFLFSSLLCRFLLT